MLIFQLLLHFSAIMDHERAKHNYATAASTVRFWRNTVTIRIVAVRILTSVARHDRRRFRTGPGFSHHVAYNDRYIDVKTECANLLRLIFLFILVSRG